jgi:hypothetical protein
VTVGCRVTQIDGRLNQSQSHFPVHFLLSNAISVPINEQKNGWSTGYLFNPNMVIVD